MTWSELDLDRGLWAIPGTRTKNHRDHVVAAQHPGGRRSCEAYLAAANTYSPRRQAAVRGWGASKERISKQAGIDVNSWRLHDLRRTCASGMQRLGVPAAVVERALNHVSGSFKGIIGTYQADDLLAEVTTGLQTVGGSHRATGRQEAGEGCAAADAPVKGGPNWRSRIAPISPNPTHGISNGQG